ncbi:TRAP transporter large permease [Acidisphaera sp. S103]|uniref:TRAP transporter large permease n=1 Tax=Acidisphaera sp. S103 TaxID=1747223 RepID=UPI00131BF515|nr:TRAP transporter large permease [Acidisphaera sp. S103]
MHLAIQLIGSFGIFLLLLAAGMAVPFAIAIPGVIYLLMQNGVTALKGIGLVTWGSMNSFTLTAIPLFVLMAEMMQRSGLSFRIYRGLAKIVARLPGGLLQTNIVGCALFASISGSSVATAASIGGVALPQLVQRNYDKRLSAGSLAAGGTLGILLPPSIAMIIYGSFTDTSVAKLFMAGVVPGFMLTLMFMAYIAVRAQFGGTVPRGVNETAQTWLGALADVVPFALLIGAIMGSIYAGWATPTEAASGGCLFSLILCLIWGDMTWRNFVQAMQRTVQVCGNLMFIIYAAYIYAYAIGVAGVGESVTSWLVGLQLSHLEFFGALFVLYTVLGCLVESIGMIVITVPLLYPVLGHYGIDPIWFGVILVMYVELGQISPPIGINLFVIQSIWDGELGDVVMGTIPFHIIMFVLLFLLAAFPQLALWLPSQMN